MAVEGSRADPSELLRLSPLFSSPEAPSFHLLKMSPLHVRHLMLAHGITDFFGWRYKLQQHANLLRHIDLAVAREGGPSAMSDHELALSCGIRGMNAAGADRAEMEEYLGRWP